MLPFFLLLSGQADPPDSDLQKAINAAKPGETLQLPSGPISGPLRIVGAENLRIVAQADTELSCGGEEPCLLIQDSKGVKIEGLRFAGALLAVQDSSGVELEALRVHKGKIRVDDAQVLVHHSTLSDMLGIDSRKGGAKLEITASYLIGLSFYPHSTPDWLHLHHNNVMWSVDIRGANSHHNLIQGWTTSPPMVDRNLTLADPGFVDADRGDLRVRSDSSALEGFGVPGPRVAVSGELAFQSTAWLGVYGWSKSGTLLAYTEPLDTGHGFCATELVLWDAAGNTPIDSVGCPFDEGPFNGEMGIQAAEHYAPILAKAKAAGLRPDIGRVAEIQTRSTVLSETLNPEKTFYIRRHQVWIDRGQSGMDPWYAVEGDFEFGLPDMPSEVTQGPGGEHLVWVMGAQLLAAPKLPKAKASCGLADVRRGQSVTVVGDFSPRLSLGGSVIEPEIHAPYRYAGRVSCELSGEEGEQAPWVQVLDDFDQVSWLHGSDVQPLGAPWSTPPIHQAPASEVSFSPLQAPQSISQASVDQGWAVLGWSPDGVVLTHAGLAPTLLASTTTLFETSSGQVLTRVEHTWPEHDPSSYRADYWARQAAFAELIDLSIAKGVRAELGHTQRVVLAESAPKGSVCLNDGGGWQAYQPLQPLRLDAVERGPWLSTGPNGAQVLVSDEGQVVSLKESETPCSDT